MKAVILAGGYGTRISEESHDKPKPLVQIGPYPIIWHIMKYFSYYGVNDFVICCGYKGYLLKEYFFNYKFHKNDFSINLKSEEIKKLSTNSEDWNVTLVDTGLNTLTGGRLKKVKKYLNKNEDFFMTYGDGLTNANLNAEIKSHIKSKKKATILAVNNPGRFGNLEVNKSNEVIDFKEKPLIATNDFINGGFIIMNPSVIDLIKNDSSSLEGDVLPKITKIKELNAFRHNGFWQPMDTLRDKIKLEEMWLKNKAPWKIWK